MVAGDADKTVTVLRPNSIYTRRLEPKLGLSEKSNARLIWQSEFRAPALTEVHKPPVGSWGQNLVDVTFCLHQQMTPLEVLRFSTAANATLRFSKEPLPKFDLTGSVMENLLLLVPGNGLMACDCALP